MEPCPRRSFFSFCQLLEICSLFGLVLLDICGAKRYSTWLYVLPSGVYPVVLPDTLYEQCVFAGFSSSLLHTNLPISLTTLLFVPAHSHLPTVPDQP